MEHLDMRQINSEEAWVAGSGAEGPWEAQGCRAFTRAFWVLPFLNGLFIGESIKLDQVGCLGKPLAGLLGGPSREKGCPRQVS